MMINGNNIIPIDNIYPNNEQTILDIPLLDYFNMPQYDIHDEKDYSAFVKDIERNVRTSWEYKKLINYLRSCEGLNKCTFLDNVVKSDAESHISIELHHTPFTLFDICIAVLGKRIANNESIEIFDICEEVMYLHYKGLVGLIPVCLTVHELIHNMYLFVPTDIVRGNFREFIYLYQSWIDPNVLDALTIADAITTEYNNDKSNPNHIINKQKALFNNYATYISIGNIAPITKILKEYKLSLMEHSKFIRQHRNERMQHNLNSINTLPKVLIDNGSELTSK